MKSVSFAGPVALALAAVAGCSSGPAPSPERTASESSAIQNGSTDTTHTFAVGIFLQINSTEGAICSGALLAPNLVATARHCVSQLPTNQVDCKTSTFGSVYPVGQFTVTTSTVLAQGATLLGVSKVVVPTGANQDGVCGNDIALLILSKNVQLPQYVEPVLDPQMTDHSMWSTTVTQIGYGITTATDTNGTSAGTRRIKQNVPLVCIPNDTSFVDCFATPLNESTMAASEFQVGAGTCEGDSGGSAYDQTQFDNGKWVSFGVVSRNPQPTGDPTCEGPVTYSRFDAWADLIRQTALEAATDGGYTPPDWATASGGSSGGSSSGSTSSGPTTGKSDGSGCNADPECSSQNCVSTNGTSFVCASPCGANNACASGMSCTDGFCFTDAPTGGHSGCSAAAAGGPSGPLPWRAAALVAIGAAAVAAARRRRSR